MWIKLLTAVCINLSVPHIILFLVGWKATETAFRQRDTKLSGSKLAEMKFLEPRRQFVYMNCSRLSGLWRGKRESTTVSPLKLSQPCLCRNSIHCAVISHTATHIYITAAVLVRCNLLAGLLTVTMKTCSFHELESVSGCD